MNRERWEQAVPKVAAQ